MKKIFQHIVILLFISNTTIAQVLYSENFDNFTTGALGFINPSTNWGNYGVNLVPGQDDWYVAENMWYSSAPNFKVRIVPEYGRDKVLEIEDIPIDSMPGAPTGFRPTVNVFKKELNLLWDQRTAGNDILKVEYEMYIPNDKRHLSNFYTYFEIRQKNPQLHFDFGMAEIIANLGPRGHDDSLTLTGPYIGAHIEKKQPVGLWVHFVIYVDYTTGYVYVEMPAFNHAIRGIRPNPTLVNTEDGMVDCIHIAVGSYVVTPGIPNIVKYDNIRISAVNTLPKLSINELFSSKFAVFPNPVTDIVTITNSEKIGIEQIEMYDISGKTVKSQSYTMENEVQLNIENVASGTYFLHIKTNEGIAVKKIVKK